jgi:anti-sigma factor (TIGR02949 family)
MTNEHDHSNCKLLLGSLSEYVDGTLAAELCEAIQAHMSECENCRIVVDTLEKTVFLVHEQAHEAVEVPAGLRKRLFQALELEDQFTE